jgi:hypothetical protein
MPGAAGTLRTKALHMPAPSAMHLGKGTQQLEDAVRAFAEQEATSVDLHIND